LLPINRKEYNRRMLQLQKISLEISAGIVIIPGLGISERCSYEERHTSKI
jgi:hypothetical protein